MPRITSRLEIPDHELSFRTSRSGGPGGQHVNTTESRVELVFDVVSSPSLSEWQRRRISDKLSNRISTEGQLSVVAQDHRSQHRNKELVVERFVELMAGALTVSAPRRKTKPSRTARRKRVDAKTRRGQKKKLRGKVRRYD